MTVPVAYPAAMGAVAAQEQTVKKFSAVKVVVRGMVCPFCGGQLEWICLFVYWLLNGPNEWKLQIV